MKRKIHHAIVASTLIIAGFAEQSSAAVSLNFSNVGATTAVATVAPGGTFKFSVNVQESSTADQVSGVDYQIKSSSTGLIEFLSRNSSVGLFTSANGYSDGYLDSSSYSPRVLNPANGTDLGTSLTDPNAIVTGPATYDQADYSFEVLPGTPTGVYTLSFVNADYTGVPPNDPTFALTPASTFTVTVAAAVPEPASAGLLIFAGAAVSIRRRRR